MQLQVFILNGPVLFFTIQELSSTLSEGTRPLLSLYVCYRTRVKNLCQTVLIIFFYECK